MICSVLGGDTDVCENCQDDRENDLDSTEEDFEVELGKLAEAYGTDLETIKKIFEGREKDRMMEDIAVQKAVSFVADNAVEK